MREPQNGRVKGTRLKEVTIGFLFRPALKDRSKVALSSLPAKKGSGIGWNVMIDRNENIHPHEFSNYHKRLNPKDSSQIPADDLVFRE